MDEVQIRTFKTTIEGRNSGKISQQETDQRYYDDEFDVGIKRPFHIVRTGTAAWIVDSIVDHIELSNPQVFREPKKATDTARESALKVSRFLNYLIREFTSEIGELVRNCVHRGEGIGQIQFDESAYAKSKKGWEHIIGRVPLIFTAPDPMIVFTEPYDALVPSRLIKSFTAQPDDIRFMYPDWDTTKKETEYLFYIDNKIRYIEADKVALTNGVEGNYLGFVPFVHCYSGFGKKSPEGKPETLAVGRLKKSRGLLKAECETESRYDSIIALYANPIWHITPTVEHPSPVSEKEMREAYIGPGSVLIDAPGYKGVLYSPDVNATQLLQHLYQIKQSLGREMPAIMAGSAGGPRESGRRADIEFEHVRKRYSKLIKNVQTALAEILGMGLRILEVTPQALPITVRATVIEKGEVVRKEEKITKEDIDSYYDCTVVLNPEEALEADRDVMLGKTLKGELLISWRRFLIKHLHLTEGEADEEMAETIAEQTIATDPIMSQMRAQEALEQMGRGKYLEKVKADVQQRERMAGELGKEPVSRGRPSEAREPLSAATLRQTLGETPVGARRPPEGAV